MRRGLVVWGIAAVIAAGSVGATNNTVRITPREEMEEFQERVQELRDARRQSMEEFKARLGQIRDQRKRLLVERLNNRMCEINKMRAARMTKHLDKMGEILDKVVTRVETARARGVDILEVETEVAQARAAIEAARSAVSAQAGADCSAVISGVDSALRAEFGQARRRLEQTLKAVHDKVVAARKETADAIRALAQVLGENMPAEGGGQ